MENMSPHPLFLYIKDFAASTRTSISRMYKGKGNSSCKSHFRSGYGEVKQDQVGWKKHAIACMFHLLSPWKSVVYFRNKIFYLSVLTFPEMHGKDSFRKTRTEQIQVGKIRLFKHALSFNLHNKL